MKSNTAKILYVEDDLALREALTEKLKKVGFNIISATNGKEGLEKAISEQPDLILLDILMPIMSGLTMLEKLRQSNDYGRKVPVILLTVLSADTEDIIKNIAKTEPIYYLVKSDISLDQVVDKIRENLAL